MKFLEFRQYQPKKAVNVIAFVCEDDFLLEESRAVWQRIFGGSSPDRWVIEKFAAKEFEDIAPGRIVEDALSPSLFAQNRIVIVTNAEKLTKARVEELTAVQSLRESSIRVVLASAARRSLDVWSKLFPIIEIDELKPGDVARWIVDRYQARPEIARYIVDNVGMDLYQIHNEIEKLQTYVGGVRPIEIRDVDILILRTEQYGRFELDDALLARDYKRAVKVVGSMLDEGSDPLKILGSIVRVWRQLFVGKSLVGKLSAKDVAAAAGAPGWKAAEFAASCRKFEWKQLAAGFGLLLNADRAFKSSSPNPEGYFDVMLWKLIA